MMLDASHQNEIWNDGYAAGGGYPRGRWFFQSWTRRRQRWEPDCFRGGLCVRLKNHDEIVRRLNAVDLASAEP